MALADVSRLYSRFEENYSKRDDRLKTRHSNLKKDLFSLVKVLRSNPNISGNTAFEKASPTPYSKIVKEVAKLKAISVPTKKQVKTDISTKSSIPEDLLAALVPSERLGVNIANIRDATVFIAFNIDKLGTFGFTGDINATLVEETSHRVSIHMAMGLLKTALEKMVAEIYPSIRGLNGIGIAHPKRAQDTKDGDMGFFEFINCSIELMSGVNALIIESKIKTDAFLFEVEGEARHVEAMTESFRTYLEELRDISRKTGKNRNRINELCGGLLALIVASGSTIVSLPFDYFYGLSEVVTELIAKPEPIESSIERLTSEVEKAGTEEISSLIDFFETEFSNFELFVSYIDSMGSSTKNLKENMEELVKECREKQTGLLNAVQVYDLDHMEIAEQELETLRREWGFVVEITHEWFY